MLANLLELGEGRRNGEVCRKMRKKRIWLPQTIKEISGWISVLLIECLGNDIGGQPDEAFDLVP